MSKRIVLLLIAIFSLSLIQAVSAEEIHQGDIIVNGNTVYSITDQHFKINGSIFIEDNATLYLNNATLEFIQEQRYQHELTLQNPSGGRPHFQCINSNVTSNLEQVIYGNFDIFLYDDFEVQIVDSFMNKSWTSLFSFTSSPSYSPFVNITNSTIQCLYDFKSGSDVFIDESDFYLLGGSNNNMDVSSSDIHMFLGQRGMDSTIRDSTVNKMMVYTTSGHGSVSIQNIAPGLVEDWNYYRDATLVDAEGPNITLLNTQIDNWRFDFGKYLDVTLTDSTFYHLSFEPDIRVLGSMTVIDSTVQTMELLWATFEYSNVSIDDLGPAYFIDFNTWDNELISIEGNSSDGYTSLFSNITLIGTQVNGWTARESSRTGSSSELSVRNSTLFNLYMIGYDEADVLDISDSEITNTLAINYASITPEKNATISNSKIKEFFIHGYTKTEMSDTVIGGGLFAYDNTVNNIYNSSLDEHRVYDNAVVNVFASPDTVESMYAHDSSITRVYDSVVEELEEFNSPRVMMIDWDKLADEITHEERDAVGEAILYVYGTSNVTRTFTFETQGDGTPVEGVTVKLFDKDGSFLKEGVSGSDGLVDIKATWGYATGMGTDDEFTVTAEKGLNSGTISVSLSSDKFQTIDMVIVDSDYDGLINEEDSCPYTPGKIEYQGCPVGDDNLVELHVIDRPKTFCGGVGSCKLPLEGALVKVFDRNDPDFQALYTKNPDGTDYPDIFENYPSIGSCVTGSDGRCIVGEETTGDYLVIVKYVDSETSKVVYTGKPKSENDFVDTDEDGIVDLAYKDFQIIKVIKNDGTVDFKAGSKTIITGSMLEVIHPQYTIWESDQELYPFIFTSDSHWTVDVCVYVPEGYVVVEGDCTQVFVSGETKDIIFTVVETNSPPPNMGFSIETNHKGKVKKLKLDVPGKWKDKKGEKPKGMPFVLAGMLGFTTIGFVKKRKKKK